jgi:aspartyl/asparaginyl beta-hydroxylase
VLSSDNNARPGRLLSARDRLAALVSRWRERHPPASLERVERFVRTLQGLAPPIEDPPGQRPDLLRFPGLSARPWHERDEFPWIPSLERRWHEVSVELDALLAQPDSFAPFVDGAGAAYREEKFGLRDRRDAWMVFDLLSPEGSGRCPRTTDMVEQVIGEVFLAQFSRLRPGTHLPAHFGLVNYQLTVHLGVRVPPGCTIRVGSETRAWTKGRCLIFDDSFEHEVWHRGEGDRVVLLVRFPHPDLTVVEIDALADIEEEVGVLLGDTAEERKASLEELRRLPR